MLRTKALAEMEVLAVARAGSGLSACAIRPAAIYGEGEERLFPRIVTMIRAGLFMCVGTKEDLVGMALG